MLQQAVWTIEFLHGCLTDPIYSYGYPEQTLGRLEEFRSALPERQICFHSKHTEGCAGCAQAQRHREVMAWWRARTGP